VKSFFALEAARSVLKKNTERSGLHNPLSMSGFVQATLTLGGQPLIDFCRH
jgi:hypothetical protein